MKKSLITLISIIYTLNIFAQTQDTIRENKIDEVTIREQKLMNNKTYCPVAIEIIKNLEWNNVQSSAHLLENSGQVLIQRSQALKGVGV